MLYRNYQLNKTHSALKFGHVIGYPAILRNCKAVRMRKLHAFGNTVQDDTPAPDNPVDVQGCGDRTANLLDYESAKNVNMLTNTNGVFTPSETYCAAIIDVSNINYVYIQGIFNKLNSGVVRIGGFADYPVNGSTGVRATLAKNGVYNCNDYHYLALSFLSTEYSTEKLEASYKAMKTFWVTEGTKPLSYEPYGYKLPLVLSNSGGETQTFPIYMDAPIYGMNGIADTVELDVANKTATLTQWYNTKVFDGTEAWRLGSSAGRFDLTVSDAAFGSTSNPRATSNYYKSVYGELNRNIFLSAHIRMISIIDTQFTTADEFKAWLSELYVAGTPLTVVYQLAAPVTTDISDMQDWNSIPKFWSGTVIISTNTTISPSNLEIKYIRR